MDDISIDDISTVINGTHSPAGFWKCPECHCLNPNECGKCNHCTYVEHKDLCPKCDTWRIDETDYICTRCRYGVG